jgi:hypothetical protein
MTGACAPRARGWHFILLALLSACGDGAAPAASGSAREAASASAVAAASVASASAAPASPAPAEADGPWTIAWDDVVSRTNVLRFEPATGRDGERVIVTEPAEIDAAFKALAKGQTIASGAEPLPCPHDVTLLLTEHSGREVARIEIGCEGRARAARLRLPGKSEIGEVTISDAAALEVLAKGGRAAKRD